MGISRVPSFSDRPGFPAGLRIILIEPDGQDCKALSAQLRECSYEVCECADETEASQQISKAEQEFDLLICEASVAAHESAAWSDFVRKVKHLPLVLTGENISQQQKLLGIKCGAVDFLEKPVALLKLRNVWQHTVRKMMKQKSTASLPEADSSAAKHSSGPHPATSADKPPAECTQESTGSSQAETTAQPDATMLKVKKCDRKARSMCDLRATRRSNLAKSASEKGATTPAAPAAQPNACAAAPAAPAPATSTGLPDAAAAPAAAAAPTAHPAYPMPQMQQQNLLPYNPQGMPAPLPGCVWGLPMLPPMAPGMMPPMAMPPQPQMMMPAQQAHMQWAQPPPYGGMMYSGAPMPQGMAPAHAVGSSAAGVPAPAVGTACIPAPAAPCGSATGSDVVMSSPVAAAGAKPKSGSPSAATWSRGDASAATHLHKVDWDTHEDGIVDDVFGLGAGADDLHDFSDSLLQADGEGCSVGKGGPAAAEEGLSWMHDECLMDDLKPADERGQFLDVVA